MAAFLTKIGSRNASLPVTFELPTNFVDWPKGEKGHLLQEVDVALPLREALDALFGRRAVVGVSPHLSFSLIGLPPKTLESLQIAAAPVCNARGGLHDL